MSTPRFIFQGPAGPRELSPKLQALLGWAGLGLAPVLGRGLGGLKATFPRPPASASRRKLQKKDALGGARVLNKTQLFFLAVPHFSRLALSRKAREDLEKRQREHKASALARVPSGLPWLLLEALGHPPSWARPKERPGLGMSRGELW